ncbi:hypothetical protein [Leifsonia aquatica]|uniref:hypothetical protein n=1 Tax=Leifsonia aquatica TaxID=144185 RepID=UPI0028AF75DD|nr:hypothetical protein [Leifsonia aquatica]
MKKRIGLLLAAAATAGLATVGVAAPASAASHISSYYPSETACKSAMASQYRAGREVNGCYQLGPGPSGQVMVPQYYFIYYT